MAYTLNSIDLSTYGIIPGHSPSSNLAMQSNFNLPARIGQTYYEWAEGTVEPYVDASELYFGGRDIKFTGSVFGTNKAINDNLQALYDAVEVFTDLVVLSTPYGDHNVQVKSIVPEYFTGACSVVITFREPVVDLTGLALPDEDTSNYTIDLIPMASFGLYYAKGSGVRSLSEFKEQFFTKYGAEGYQMSQRKPRAFNMKATLMATSLADFQNKVNQLYLLFSSPGLRSIVINNEILVSCFAVEGFDINGVLMYGNCMIANFEINLICVTVSLITVDSTMVYVDDQVVTVDEN